MVLVTFVKVKVRSKLSALEEHDVISENKASMSA